MKKGIENVLGSQWNVLTPRKDVTTLLEEVPNVLTKIKETNVIDTNSVLKKSKEEAASINDYAMTGATPVTSNESKELHQNIV